jgi:broad specificity phosphatase PhoE
MSSSAPATREEVMNRMESMIHHRRTLYLVRHGEALHNVEEVKAQELARQKSLELGFSKEETLHKMEEARKAVLKDPTLFDAPLTELGRQQAQEAGRTLVKIIEKGTAPAPTEAMVSPLSRCLDTADIILKQHHSKLVEDERGEAENGEAHPTERAPALRRRSTMLVHIRPELRERQTQYPPDTPQTPDQLYHWTEQRFTHLSGGGYRFHAKALTGHDLAVEESRTQLRERARKLFDVLMELKHRHVLIVSHKGYLREMEQGLLGLAPEDAPEFQNAEVRVYHVVFTRGERTLESVERLV